MNDQLFRHSSAKTHANLVVNILFGIVSPVALGTHHRKAAGVAARDNGNFMHGVAVLAQLCKYGMPGLVVSGKSLFGLGNDLALLRRSHRNLIERFVKLAVAYKLLICSRRKNCRLV